MPRVAAHRNIPETNVTPPYVVRRSVVHGNGVFASRSIKRGEVIDEYVGDRISHAQANERYSDRDVNDNHTFLFTVSSRTVIDGRIGGNDVRFINHKCEPNCEPQIRRGRVFIVATRAIAVGEELGYEYNIGREDDDPPNVDEIYACRCGSSKCRGTILWPPKLPAVARQRRNRNAGARANRSAGAGGHSDRKRRTSKHATGT